MRRGGLALRSLNNQLNVFLKLTARFFWSISLSLQDLPTNPYYCTFGPVPNVHLR
jgi:hypothetical protein